MGNYIGRGLLAALGAPATNDQAGVDALTFVALQGYSLVPRNRFTTSDIDTESVFTGIVTGQKGGGTGDNQVIAFNTTEGNGGHTQMQQWGGFGQDEQVTFQVVSKDAAAAEFFVGILRNYKQNEGTITSDDGFVVEFRQNREGFAGTPVAAA